MHDPSRHRAYSGGSPRSSSPAATQPFDFSTTLAGNGGSPIAADKIYRARSPPPLALLVPCSGGADIPLPAGVHHLDGTAATAELVVLTDGSAYITDLGTPSGVCLGHRRERVTRNVRYALADGRLVHVGGREFWFRDLRHPGSRSPTPPWRRSPADVPGGSPGLADGHSDLEEDALHGLGLTQQMDAISREMLGASGGRQRAQQQQLLALSPPLLVPIDLRHGHAAESQVRLLTQDAFTQEEFTQGLGNDESLRLDDLRVAESPRSDAPAEAEEEVEQLAATQPVSPARRPPDALPPEMRNGGAWLPEASPLVHATRAVLMPNAATAYPYDFGGLQAALDCMARASEMGATQPEESNKLEADGHHVADDHRVAEDHPVADDRPVTDDERGAAKGRRIKRESAAGGRISSRINTQTNTQTNTQISLRLRRTQQGSSGQQQQPPPRQTRAQRGAGSENHDVRTAASGKPQRTRARPLNLVSTGSSGSSNGAGTRTPRTPRTPVRLSGAQPSDGFPELAPMPTAPLSARAARPPRTLPPLAAKQRRHTLAPPASLPQHGHVGLQPVVEIDLSSSPMLPPPEALLAAAAEDDRPPSPSPQPPLEAVQTPVVVLRPPPLQKPRRMTRRASASLRDSLSRLPGAKGVARTQLTSKRRRTLQPATPPPPLADPADPADPTAAASPVPSPSIALATLTGFASAADRRRATQQLRARHMVRVTDDPLAADVCVCGGPLARKLKVLCALARGTPLVDARWISAASAASSADEYVVESPDVEAAWGVSVRATLARARQRAADGRRLLAGFCVHLDGSVAEPRDIGVLAQAAGAVVLGMQQRAEPRESLGADAAGWSTAATLSDFSGSGSGGSSSTEPDDDADEDWDSQADDLVQRPRVRRPRKTLPRLSEPLPKLQRENSVLLAAPQNAVSRSSSATSLAKRRRIDSPSPEEQSAQGDLVEMLRRMRRDAGVPEDARVVVVVEAADARAARERWAAVGALVVAPEDIIQSVLRCEITFVP